MNNIAAPLRHQPLMGMAAYANPGDLVIVDEAVRVLTHGSEEAECETCGENVAYYATAPVGGEATHVEPICGTCVDEDVCSRETDSTWYRPVSSLDPRFAFPATGN